MGEMSGEMNPRKQRILFAAAMLASAALLLSSCSDAAAELLLGGGENGTVITSPEELRHAVLIYHMPDGALIRAEDIASDDVIWALGGSVYHRMTACTYISDSDRLYTGSREEAAKSGITRSCPRCCPGG